MKTVNITMVKGDTMEFTVRFDGLEEDLTAAVFTVRTAPTASAAILTKTLGSGITKVETGYYDVRVAPADTASVAAGTYVYDLQVTVGSDVYTIIMGDLNILQDVTR